jgi:hypothetical protein
MNRWLFIILLAAQLVTVSVTTVLQHEEQHRQSYEKFGYRNNTLGIDWDSVYIQNHDKVLKEDYKIIYLSNQFNDAVAYNTTPLLTSILGVAIIIAVQLNKMNQYIEGKV